MTGRKQDETLPPRGDVHINFKNQDKISLQNQEKCHLTLTYQGYYGKVGNFNELRDYLHQLVDKGQHICLLTESLYNDFKHEFNHKDCTWRSGEGDISIYCSQGLLHAVEDLLRRSEKFRTPIDTQTLLDDNERRDIVQCLQADLAELYMREPVGFVAELQVERTEEKGRPIDEVVDMTDMPMTSELDQERTIFEEMQFPGTPKEEWERLREFASRH